LLSVQCGAETLWQRYKICYSQVMRVRDTLIAELRSRIVFGGYPERKDGVLHMFLRRSYIFRLLIITIVTLLATTTICIPAETTPLFADSLKAFEARAASADADGWRFVFLGDNRGNDDKFKEILQRARDLKPLFILHGGDIVEKGSAAELAHFLDVVKSVKGLPPLFVVRGNHEGNAALFEKMIGPLNFVIDSQRLGLRLVAVDNSNYVLSERELAFLARNLDQKRQNQFVAMHIPPKTERWPDHTFEKGRDALLTLMKERKVRMGLFSHIHLFDVDTIKGIPYIISGGAGSQLAWYGYSGDVMYHLVIVDVVKGKASYRVERFDTSLVP
jgi:3',5'-cyclic-AMP phosphodiesterase